MNNLLHSNPSKLENRSNPIVTAIIQKKKERKSRLVKINLDENKKLNYVTDVCKYCEFSVDESGYYNINNQCCIKALSDNHVEIMQFGICDRDLSEFGQCINSKVLKVDVSKDNIICENLTTFKYLEENKKYIVWLNVVSDENLKMEYIKEYSHLVLIKL